MISTINPNPIVSIGAPQFLKEPKSFIRIGICSVCLGLLYFQVFRAMVNDWIHLPDFSHGFFIPFLSLYFAWNRREKLDNLPFFPEKLWTCSHPFGPVFTLIRQSRL